MGIKFLGRTPKKISVKLGEKTTDFEIVRIFEFNSDRKRMSILLKKHGRIKLFMKGADNVILSRLSKKKPQLFLKNVLMKLDEFSKRGLRTLCVAMKVLEPREVEHILKKIDKLADNIDKPRLTGYFKFN